MFREKASRFSEPLWGGAEINCNRFISHKSMALFTAQILEVSDSAEERWLRIKVKTLVRIDRQVAHHKAQKLDVSDSLAAKHCQRMFKVETQVRSIRGINKVI